MRIAEVSKQFALSADTLRYYEKIGLMNPVAKDKSGIRNYQEQDLKRINFIKCMRMAGLGIEAIKRYVDLFNEGLDTIPQRKQILVEQEEILKTKMRELQITIDYLHNKIESYEDTLVKREKEAHRKTV